MSDLDRLIFTLELRNKVRKGCKCHTEYGCERLVSDYSGGLQREFCPYFEHPSCQDIYKDVIALLEPQPVERYDKQMQMGACPSCSRALSRYMRFCPVCGQEVVWDD